VPLIWINGHSEKPVIEKSINSGDRIMKVLSVFGIIGAAALLAATPFSLHWCTKKCGAIA
jgi:hypothetical protein